MNVHSLMPEMESVYYTITAIFLYFAADFILQQIEAYHGKVLEQRNIVFFVILLVLAVSSFAMIRWMFSL